MEHDGSAHRDAKRQVSLARTVKQHTIAAEFVRLLETLTADGQLRKAEIGSLKEWLDCNRESKLAGVEFLRNTIAPIWADGTITPERAAILYRALPRP